MNTLFNPLRLMRLSGVAALLYAASPSLQAQNPDALPEQDGVEYLTRGPVHEAFSSVIVYQPEPGLLVSSAPPEVVDEVPPERRPEGENVAWIPGYWTWEDERSEFIWISGIWRVVPPDRQWVPGYWADLGGQYQWTSGYWASVAVAEQTYLPHPPETLEKGPNIPRPQDDSVWLPGHWAWNTGRYQWSPGYWETGRSEWVWVPPHYVWTPHGHVFVDGYWDYTMPRRGMLFSPVRFSRPVYEQPGYRYQPLLTIAVSLLAEHLFLRPSSCHYYFGDYYEPRYRSAGYYPPFFYSRSSRGYDPLFVHQLWLHRTDSRYIQTREKRYDFFRDNSHVRPPHTWADFRRSRGNERDRDFALPLAQLTQAGPGRKITSLTNDDRQRYLGQSKAMKTASKQLQALHKGSGKPSVRVGQTIKLPPSPIAAIRGRSESPPAPTKQTRPSSAGPDKAVTGGKGKSKGGEGQVGGKPAPGSHPQVTKPAPQPSGGKPQAKPSKEVKPDPRPSPPVTGPRSGAGKPKGKGGEIVRPAPRPARPPAASTPQKPKSMPKPESKLNSAGKQNSSNPSGKVNKQTSSRPKAPAVQASRPSSPGKGNPPRSEEDKKKK